MREDIITGERAVCVQCGEEIGAVVDPYSGSVDWGGFFPYEMFGDTDKPRDFGCNDSPDTDEEGTGSHDPGERHTPSGFKILVDSRSYWEAIERQKKSPQRAQTIEQARTEAAERNARNFGTDPSWYGR